MTRSPGVGLTRNAYLSPRAAADHREAGQKAEAERLAVYLGGELDLIWNP